MLEDVDDDDVGSCPVCGSKGYSCRDEAMLGSGGGVRIVRLHDGESEGTMHTLTAKTWVNSDSTKVVPAGSIEAAFLLGIAGDEISDETAKRLGLDQAKASGYGSMKKAELLEIAEARGVEIEGKPTNAELVAILEMADKLAAELASGGGVAQAEGPAEA